MKKIYPYILPALALIFVAFLAYRWYMSSTQVKPEISPFGEGVQIENLSQEEADKIVKGVGDYETEELTGATGIVGAIRYEIKDGRVSFSATADLPKSGLTPEQKDKLLKAMVVKKALDVMGEAKDNENQEPTAAPEEAMEATQEPEVMMDLDKEAEYTVWLQKEGSEEKVRAYDLVFGKSGFFGSGSLSADLLPFDIIITQESADGSSIEVLRGTISNDQE